MEQNEKYSILDELDKCSGYDIALMTTFNFEISFFERMVLNRLLAKNVKTVTLFVDSKEFTSALNEFDIIRSGSYIGRKYMVNPVRMQGSFHPKVILLLGEKKARLFVGSANVKSSGYAINNEVFNYVDYDSNNNDNLDVIVSAIDFFAAINELSYKLDDTVIKRIKNYIYYHKAGKNGKVFLLHNVNKPILEQVSDIITNKVNTINIAVPYYDKELLALQQIKNRFPGAEINLYIQNKNSTFPIEYNEKNDVAEKIYIFHKFLDNTSFTSGNFYHGKVFLFKTNDEAFVLYGSANCTLSALSKTHISGGNIECDFLEVGLPGDFDYFFENMDFGIEEKLTSQKMTYESIEHTNFYFKYGTVKESVELYIGYIHEYTKIVIKFHDKELEYKLTDGEIVAYISDEDRVFLSDIFEITIAYEESSETLRCWTFNSVLLSNNREMQNRSDNLSDFEIDSHGKKYIEDRIKYLRAEATCLNEWYEYKNNQKYINQIKLEQESEDAEDFIVDYQIPDEYRYAYRQYNSTSKIRGIFVGRFLGESFISSATIDNEVIQNDEHISKQIFTPVCRQATSEEIKFERFIKGKVKGMLNDLYVDVIETEHYIGLVQVVMEIFKKYRDDENVENIFQLEYVVETKSRFMKKILGKSLDNLSDKEKLQNAIIQKSLQTILETYLFYRNLQDSDAQWRFETLNRNLLGVLEKKYNQRQTYGIILKQVIKEGKGGILTLGYEGAYNYIEQLYGYKSYEMLCELICKIYPTAETSLTGTILRISAKTENILGCNRPDVGLLKEIFNFSRSVSKVTTVNIDFENIAENIENKNIIVKMSHSINMEYHQWRFTEKRLKGEMYSSKTQYISF